MENLYPSWLASPNLFNGLSLVFKGKAFESLEGEPSVIGSKQQCKTKEFLIGGDVILILTEYRPWGGGRCIDKKRGVKIL